MEREGACGEDMRKGKRENFYRVEKDKESKGLEETRKGRERKLSQSQVVLTAAGDGK